MNVESANNNAAQVALNAAIANTQAQKTAENAQEAGGTILTGAGVTMSTAAPTTEEVAAARNADGAQAALIQETVTDALVLAEQVDDLASSLQAAAVAAGEQPTTVSAPVMTTSSVAQACEDVASGSTTVVVDDGGSSSWVEDGKDVQANFSIYQLANLLQEVGQQERDAARELRSAELETELASIDSQALKQRRGATLSCAVSVLTCVAQVGLMAYSYKASTKQDNTNAHTGEGMNVRETKQSVDTMKAAQVSDGGKTIGAVADQLEMNADPKVRKAANKAIEGCAQAKNEYNQIDAKMGEISSFKSMKEAEAVKLGEDIAAADANGDTATVEAKTGELNKCKAEIQGAQETLDNLEPMRQSAAEKYGQALDVAVEEANVKYDKAFAETDAAQGTKRAGLKDKSTKLGTKISNDRNVNKCRERQDIAGQERSLVEAKAWQEKVSVGLTPSDGDIKAGLAKVEESENVLKTVPKEKVLVFDPKKQAAIQQGASIIGQIGQSLAGMSQHLSDAAVTSEKGNEKESDAQRQETNDLYSQAGELIKAARELFQSVIQSESQSIEKIISA